MLRDHAVETESKWGDNEAAERRVDFREVDRQLRRLAKTRSGLDSVEARWLREADAGRIWRDLGFATALEYLEDVFGYAPRTAIERVRVAKALGELPAIDRELADGALSYSAARELTRVAAADNEQQWLDRARGKNLRDIEELVSGHKKGDGPEDDKDPTLVKRTASFELSPEVFALLRQTRAAISDERGAHVEDADFIEAVCRFYLAGGASKSKSPAYRVNVTKCPDCRRGWQDGAGVRVELGKEALERAECDAEVVDLDATPAKRPSRTIPKRVVDKVWNRDQGRCRFPGCRSARNLEVHHIRFWSHGGEHHEDNCAVQCFGHHQLIHTGKITVAGNASGQLTFTRDGKVVVDARAETEQRACDELRASSADRADHASSAESIAPQSPPRRTAFGDVEMIVMAKQALKTSGYHASIAKTAVEAACAHVGAGADLATLIMAALQHCR
jgi:hypothetical protein